MSIKKATIISIGMLMFSALVPLIVSESDIAGYGYAGMALGLVMGVVGTLQLATIILSVNAVNINTHRRCLWLRPIYYEDFDAHRSVLKPLGIVMFCVFGVYSSDVSLIAIENASECESKNVDIFF
jgi:hypothetical protein